MKKTVAGDWQQYRALMLPKQLDGLQEDRLRQAFVAGGICVFERVMVHRPDIVKFFQVEAELKAQLDLALKGR